MKRANALVKVAAVASSALLFAGLVAYRAGAFDQLTAPETSATEPGPGAVTDAPPDAAAQATDASLMSSSKRITFVVPPGGAKKDPSKSPTFLPGSKSVAPLLPPAAPKDEPAPQSPTPTKPNDGLVP